MYPVGWPLWRLAARAGLPLRFDVSLHFDSESKTFWANSPDIDGLVVSGQDLEEVQREAIAAAETLLELQLHRPPKLHMHPQVARAIKPCHKICHPGTWRTKS